MDIGSLVTRAVLTVNAGDSLRDAAVDMMERGVGSAVVLAEGKVTGILTDRESLRAIAQGKDAQSLTVADFMVRRPTTITPSMELLEAARIMREKGFRHLVVIDEQDRLVGVFSMRDLVVGLLEERRELARAGDTSTVPPSELV